MFAIDFEVYINKLDTSTVNGEVESIRKEYSDTDEGYVVQRILGNFWDDPKVETNLAAIIKVLTDFNSGQSSFISNRFALLTQLENNPNLKDTDKRTVSRRIESICKDVSESVGMLLSCAPESRKHRWLLNLSNKNINESLVSYLTLGLHNKKYNLAAYLFMDKIEPINLNFNCFATHPLIDKYFRLGILRVINRSSIPKDILSWLCAAYPEIKETSIHRNSY